MSEYVGWQGPNPGSDEALRLGCICAVLDNNHGKWAPWPPDSWWISAGCPIHAGVKMEPEPKPEPAPVPGEHLTQKETNAKGGGDPEQPPNPPKGESHPGSTFEDQGRPI